MGGSIIALAAISRTSPFGAGLIITEESTEITQREKALQILAQNPDSNLGWRIILACGPDSVARDLVREAVEKNVALHTLIASEQRNAIAVESAAWVAAHAAVDIGAEPVEKTASVAVASYEGSKGRSAQYVFLVGLHSGEFPANSSNIQDIEICRFLVGLTLTKKKCDLLFAKNAMGKWKTRSEFLDWIRQDRFQSTQRLGSWIRYGDEEAHPREGPVVFLAGNPSYSGKGRLKVRGPPGPRSRGRFDRSVGHWKGLQLPRRLNAKARQSPRLP